MADKKMPQKNPIQPLALDEHGTLRFKKNEIVNFLLDWSSERGMDLNELAMMSFSRDDRMQFAQMIGYSLCGWGDLSYVDNDTWEAADKMWEAGMTEDKARIAHLEKQLDSIRKGLLEPISDLYNIAEEDLDYNGLY